jgi:multicomponent Na+:H+ antiporter subunit E
MMLHAKRFALFLGLWLLLTAADKAALAPGLAAAAAAALLSHRLAPSGEHRIGLVALLLLFPGFLWRSLVGGLDVARRAFSPTIPLRPGWVRYQTSLADGLPRVALGSQLSLMPGTLAAGSEGNAVLVHCLDVEDDVILAIAAEEQRLLRAFTRT